MTVKNPILIVTMVGLASLIGSVAYAQQTPDGETPAVESVCDPLVGATPGLYGLCVAYCEAQDCDEETAQSGQCKAANPKVLEAYNKKRGPNDPSMPCVADPCPCFTAQLLANEASQEPTDCRGTFDARLENLFFAGNDAGACGGFAQSLARFDELGNFTTGQCFWRNYDRDAVGGGCVSGPVNLQEVSLEQVRACQALIYDHADAVGRFCPLP